MYGVGHILGLCILGFCVGVSFIFIGLQGKRNLFIFGSFSLVLAIIGLSGEGEFFSCHDTRTYLRFLLKALVVFFQKRLFRSFLVEDYE